MTPEVSGAIEDIRTAFPDNSLVIREDHEGGALIIVEDLELGPPYIQESTWMGFHITHPYPYSDPYPQFVRGDLARIDGRPLGEATSLNATFESRPAVQLSRKANRLNPTTDTALSKLLKVLTWLKTRS